MSVAAGPQVAPQPLGIAPLARGVARLFLEMREGNTAEALYRRRGFSSVGRRRDYYRRGSGGPLDAITFTLELKAPR